MTQRAITGNGGVADEARARGVRARRRVVQLRAQRAAAGVRVLASLDESSYTPREIFRDLSMGDHPVLEGAVAWAAGLTGDCPPPR